MRSFCYLVDVDDDLLGVRVRPNSFDDDAETQKGLTLAVRCCASIRNG